MASGALPLDRLRQFLRELPAGTRSLLVAELERAVLRGDEIPGGAMLLQEVRSLMRAANDRTPRCNAPARLFFRPVEPFLVDNEPRRKVIGRIMRAALDPMWIWLSRDLMAAECEAYSAEVTAALAVGADEQAAERVDAFQDLAAARIATALADLATDEKGARRLANHIATTTYALEEVRDVQAVLTLRDPLAALAAKLPSHIRNLGEDEVEAINGLLDSPLFALHPLQAHALVLVANRLAVPWQLIRLAVRAEKTDDVTRIAGGPYAGAVMLTLADIERMVADLRSDLRRGLAVGSLLKSIHDAVRGVRTELDLSADSPWARQLAAIRADISDALKSEIESVPGRVRRLLRPRSNLASQTALDPAEVEETAALVELVTVCRNYASELAISEVSLRVFQDLQQYLDAGTRALLEALRNAGGHEHRYRKSQMEAAIAFCSKCFGADYASLLAKAAEAADHGERRSVARA